MEYQYSNEMHGGGATPRLYLAKGDKVVKFVGDAIPAFCGITTEKYIKNGKWSHYEYLLNLAQGVRPLYLCSPLHGIWGQQFASWGEVAEHLGLSLPVAHSIVRKEYAKTATRLDEVERFAMEQEAQGSDVEEVVISFGNPTNRRIAEGYWEQPKSRTTADGSIEVIVAPDAESGWSKPELIQPTNAKISDVSRLPGMHGGYVSITVQVPVKK